MERRILGDEHPSTLTTANNLARSLSGQGKHKEAERVARDMLGVQMLVRAQEHPYAEGLGQSGYVALAPKEARRG